MSESGSQRSGDASETSSQAADREVLRRRNKGRNNNEGEEDDLLEQRKSLQEGVFSAMYMLSRSKSTDSWLFAAIKIMLEGLIPLLVVFNPTNGWAIDISNPLWQVLRWVLPRSPVARIFGYDVYIRVFYAIVAVLYITMGCIGVLTLAMRRQEHSKALRRFARLLQLVTEVVFTLAYMSVFDFMVFLFDCKFTAKGTHPHDYWTEVECLETPHIIHMCVAGVTAIVFFCCTALMLVAGCDLSPVAPGIMASPSPVTRLRVLVLKAAFVIVINTLASVPKVQCIVVTVAVAGIAYFNFIRLPFLRPYINFLYIGDWAAVLYTCVIFCMLEFGGSPENLHHNKDMVNLVLYGVFPAYFAGALATWVWYRYRMLPTPKFINLDPHTKLKKVHEFGSPEEVEVLARNMRQFDIDGVVYEEAGFLGETIIKCGMAVFPGNVELLVLYANFLMEVRRDGPAARTQLQLALKGGPSFVQRYGIFSTIESSKRLRDGQEGTLDLQSYVEFKRNYRAVIRVHKTALTAQREFWQLMQKSSVPVSAIEAHLREMDQAAEVAHQVYKRVLERYPNNGKLLRCYGKFLEDVRNDPMAATRAYAEAARHGGGDGLMALDLQIGGSHRPEFLTTMDLHEDTCIVINAEGIILMVNSCVNELLGYPKAELEGANVSMIMPQPFSGRHQGYLSRYAQGGEAHILDTVRDVVALHKDRHVFPLQICVTKLSGVGSDAIFLGLLRPQPLDARNMRCWVAPNGAILCTDPQFASLTGLLSDEMVGRTFQSLCTDNAAAESLLEVCRETPYDSLVAGMVTRELHIMHRHLAPVPVEIMVSPGGTDSQRIFVFNARRTDGNTDGLMVFDTKGGLTFATWDVAAMLGYPLDKFLKMRLDQLLPPPFATMHERHLRDPPPVIPPSSCRAGRVVQLLNSNGAQVAVRLGISTQDDAETGKTKHIVQVRKLDASDSGHHFDCRLAFTCTMNGRILAVDHPDSNLFGFTASAVIGSNLADCIDVFAEWRVKAGAHQMELFLLSLLEREMEVPGTSWRVKVHTPESPDSLPNIDPKAPPREVAGRSACLQSELIESTSADVLQAAGLELGFGAAEAVDETHTLVRIILWRRDLLTGVIELDNKLMLRKADVNTGLIVGLPPSALARAPLHKILDIPRGQPWEQLMADKRRGAEKRPKKKSALKKSSGLMVSPVHAFEGSHPDGGTMRVFLQGVSGAEGGRVYATLHPDTNFKGARANIYRALGLEALLDHGNHHHHGQGHGQSHGHASQAGGPGNDPAAGTNGPRAPARTEGSPVRNPAPAPGAASAVIPASLEGPVQGRSPAHAASGTGLGAVGGAGTVPGGDLDDGDWPERDRASERRPGASDEEGDEEAGLREREGARGAAVSSSTSSSASSSSSHDDDGSDDPEDGEDREEGDGAKARRRKKGRKNGSEEGEVEQEEEMDPEHLHKTAKNQSDFVARWVRTLARQMTGVGADKDPAADTDVIPLSRAVSRMPSRAASDAAANAAAAAALAAGGGGGEEVQPDEEGPRPGGVGRKGSAGAGGGAGFTLLSGAPRSSRRRLDLGGLPPVTEDAAEGEVVAAPGSDRSGSARASRRGGGRSMDSVDSFRRSASGFQRATSGFGARSRDGGSDDDNEGTGKRRRRWAAGVGEEDGAGNRSQSNRASDNDDASSVGGDDDAASQGIGGAFTDASSAVDVDLNIDARRTRLLKRLNKALSGPYLTAPLLRMRYHTWALLAIMLVTHVIMYVIFISLIERQFANVRGVHRLAMAADRGQLVTVRAVLAEFCSRPGIEPVAVCENPLSSTLNDLRASIEDLEAYHQETYLGMATVPHRPKDPTVYYLWTEDTVEYKFYMDTTPPMWSNETTGVWQLGNRFVATSRELLYWIKALGGRIGALRATQFVVANGPWGLFLGYSNSLQYLVKYAWDEVSTLQRGLIIMLLVEAAGVQLACILYQWWLVRAVELARRGELLTSLGIPGPMLRVLANRPVVVVEDSDDDDNDEEEAAGEGGGAVAATTGGGAGDEPGGDNNGGKRASDTGSDWDQDLTGTGGPGLGPPGAAALGATGSRVRRMSMDMAIPAPGTALPLGGAFPGMDPSPAGFGAMAFAPPPPLPAAAASAGALIGGKRGAAGGVQRVRGGRVAVNGKVLVPSYKTALKFMLPLVLWEIALVIVGAISYLRLEGMQGPLASLNMASHVIYRYTRVRAMALLLIAGSTPAERDFYRTTLRTELDNLASEYDTLMYGGLAITQAGSAFQKPVPASTFADASFSYNFFREERCFRWDQSKCYPPDSPYYEVTHHGLDVMMRRILSEMRLLASDDDADATYNGTRYTTMYHVGTKDLYEGLQSSAELFVNFSISRYNSIKLLQTILLAVTVVFFAGYALLLLRPYGIAVQREAVRLAGLLSHVPAEMDVVSHVRQVLRNHERLVGGGRHAGQPGHGHRLWPLPSVHGHSMTGGGGGGRAGERGLLQDGLPASRTNSRYGNSRGPSRTNSQGPKGIGSSSRGPSRSNSKSGLV